MREVDVYPAGVRDARTTGKLAEPNPNTGRQDRRSAGLPGVEKSTEAGEVASLRKKIRELEKQRVGWKKAEREFEAQILARSSETDRISAKVLLLERELAMAAMAASGVGDSFWNERKAWLGAVGAAAVVGLIFLCVAAWRGGSRAPLAASRPSISTTYPASAS